MMRGMRDAPRHDPCAGALHGKKSSGFFPPIVALTAQPPKPFSAVSRVLLHELQPSLLLRQGRCSDVDSKHRPKPHVFADALMHHLLMNTASPRIVGPGTNRKILVAEFPPHADHLDPFGCIGLD